MFVVWDLIPCDPPFQSRGKPSRRNERLHLRTSLRPEDCARTEMICIRHELESWLLADGAALEKVVWRKTHRKKPIADDKHPEQHPNPKLVLKQHFEENGPFEYDDKVHALKIIKAVNNLSKIERASPSFRHLREKLAAL